MGRDINDYGRGKTDQEMQAFVDGAPPYEGNNGGGKSNRANGEAEHDARAISIMSFRAYMPMHQYLFEPNGEMWPASSVNSRLPLIMENGKPTKPSDWLDQHRPIDQMTWWPGQPRLFIDRLVCNGGLIEQLGATCFNLYHGPRIEPGCADEAGSWINHVQMLYGEEANHIIRWLAHRVQHPGTKINHALVLGGPPGCGKDTLLEPVKRAVGPWNFADVTPIQMLGRFNAFVKSVILRVSEARDLGDVDRYSFYEHMKVFAASPPDVLFVDEKNVKAYSVLNCAGIIITTNHKLDGLYLPLDDRRHFVAWTDRIAGDFTADYWRDLYGWYETRSGYGHVAAYLRNLDLREFDPKAPPKKTPAFWDIVQANSAPEDGEMADALDRLDGPNAVTLPQIIAATSDDSFREYLQDRRNSRKIPHRLDAAGYVAVRNPTSKDGLWVVASRRKVIYARKELAERDRQQAAMDMSGPGYRSNQ